jgi:hypothetical protein
MKLPPIASLIGFVILSTGCRSPSNQLQDKWSTLYRGDPSLIRIVATQYPENPYEMKDYAGRHPAVVEYTFKDETQRVISFLPDGEVIADYRVDKNGKRIK